MSFPIEVLIVLGLGILAQATGIDLANNTTFLLLLLLILGAYGTDDNDCRCNLQRSYT